MLSIDGLFLTGSNHAQHRIHNNVPEGGGEIDPHEISPHMTVLTRTHIIVNCQLTGTFNTSIKEALCSTSLSSSFFVWLVFSPD